MKKKTKRLGRPRGSKGKPKNREQAIVEALTIRMKNVIRDYFLCDWNKSDEELLNILKKGRDREAAFWTGFLSCRNWIEEKIFPKFIKYHARI